MTLAQIIGTVGGVGYMRPASGTWGSLAALPLAWLVYLVGGVWLVVILGAALFAAGVWATAEMTRGSDNHDPSEVVMDEVVGQWIALLPVLIGAAHVGAPALVLWPGWVVAFLAFRLFDIWKPGPVGWADRRNDPLGVMLDDVIAGVFAAITVALAATVVHGFLM